ncbi:MAG: AsnC family transcriptional regulator [Rhodocyclaceae bacterium]|nr:AsnC family transcriptional regulator [Rhodocyclaceae bacterium]MBX3668663.1 AsnC family transcriptional regulator [Rhodocyclaceae bacterium]
MPPPRSAPLPERHAVADLDELDRAIINRLQGDFPLCDEPYAEAARELGVDAGTLIERLRKMLAEGVLTRFGPMFQVERMGGRYLLAAMAVPEAHYDAVAQQVNALDEVAHNYRREHELNMWFVLAVETPAAIADCIARIEVATGLKVYAFPKQREFFVEMKLTV